ncbi:MAG: hypothetical protein RI973_2004, partial [Bacteroidota bacterium]
MCLNSLVGEAPYSGKYRDEALRPKTPLSGSQVVPRSKFQQHARPLKEVSSAWLARHPTLEG